VMRRCVWSRNIKNMRSIYIYIYIYDISSLRVNCKRAIFGLCHYCIEWANGPVGCRYSHMLGARRKYGSMTCCWRIWDQTIKPIVAWFMIICRVILLVQPELSLNTWAAFFCFPVRVFYDACLLSSTVVSSQQQLPGVVSASQNNRARESNQLSLQLNSCCLNI